MVDFQDLNGAAGAAALPCDRAIFTSLPSRTGEGYRLVAWSGGLRAEERQELTRRAPSHGSLLEGAERQRATVLFRLQASGRAGWAMVRAAGVEHTRRGGGRVWTDFVVADSSESVRHGLHPCDIASALAAEPAPKPPLGTNPLVAIDIGRSGSGEPAASGPRAVAAAVATASILLGGQACVVAAGSNAADVLDDALRMIPAALRGTIDACAGLRFSPSRGVKATLTDRIDQETIRATRGHNVLCIDLEKKTPDPAGPLVPWLALVSRWWLEDRGADAVELADRLAGDWSPADILGVAALCESIDRGEERPERLGQLLTRRSAA